MEDNLIDESELNDEEELQFPKMVDTSPLGIPERDDRTAAQAAVVGLDTTDPDEMFDQYSESFSNYKSSISMGGEEEIRDIFDQEYLRKRDGELTAFATETMANEDTVEAERVAQVQASLEAISYNYGKDIYGLEELAVESIKELSLGDPDQLDYQERLLNDDVAAEIDDSIRDHMTRSLILAQEFEKISIEHEEQDLWDDTLDFFGRFIPTHILTSSDNIVEDVGSLANKAGLNLQNLTQELLFGLSKEEFATELPKAIANLREQSGHIGENLAVLRENFAVIAGGASRISAQKINEASALDLVLGLPLVTVAKGSMAGVSKLLGNRSLAQTVTAQTLLKNMGEETVEGVAQTSAKTSIDDALPTNMNSTQMDTTGYPGLAGIVADTLSEIRQATANIKNQLGDLGRMDGAEVRAMVAGEVGKIREGYKGRVLPFDIIPVREGGQWLIDMALGKKSGGMFKDLDSATKAAKRMGLKHFTVDDIPGQGAFIKVRHNMNESPYYRGWLEKEVNTKMPFLAFLRSPDSFNPEVVSHMAAQASFQKSAYYTQLRAVQKKFQGLPKAERERLDAISVLGNEKNKWFTPEEFTQKYVNDFKTLPKEREMIAYYAQKEMHDLNWGVLDWAERTKLASNGWVKGSVKVVGTEASERTVKQLESMDDFRNAIIHRPDKDTLLFGEELSKETLEALMKNEGLVLFKTLEDFPTSTGTPANYILAKKGDVATSEITNVIPYRAGGPRAYDANFFIKQFQDSVVPFKGGTRRIIKNPSTLIAGRSMTELKEAAGKLENARLLYKDGKLTDELVNELTPYTTLDEWEKAIARNEINADHPFSIVRDGESPKANASVLDEAGDYNIATETAGANLSGEASGRLLMSRRGKPLYNADYGTAKIISPNELIQNVTDNLLHTASFTDFKISSMQRWVKTYSPYLNTKDMSPEQTFWKGEFKANNPAQIEIQANASRDAIKRILSSSSSDSSVWRSGVTEFARFVDNKGYGETSAKILSVQNKDPINAMKGMAFDLKLGMFDPSQLIIQTQTIAAMAALRDPVTASKFAWQGGWIRASHVNQSAEFLSYAAKKSGMDVDEFKMMGKEMQRGGYLDVNGEMILTDHHATATYGKVGSAIRNARNMARFPFYEAERLNRAYGFRMAWDDLTQKYTDKAKLDKAFKDGEAQRFLSGKTNDYTMNMLNTSAAGYQKGLLAVPTQFMSYQLRMLENILPEVLGGSKAFTSTQKVRMVAGQMLLYGAAGVPFGRYLADKTIEATGAEFDESMSDQTLHRLIAGGLTDSMIYLATTGEVDVAFSKRAAVGTGIESFIGDIFGLSVYEKSMAELIFGASASVGGQVLSDAFESIQYAALAASSEQVGVAEVTPLIAKALAENVSSLSRAMKAYYVYKYGVFTSQTTGKALTFATPMESMATLLGVPLRDVGDISYISGNMTRRKEFIKENSNIVVKLRNEAFRALNAGDLDTYQARINTSAAFLQSYDIGDRYAIIKSANAQASMKTVYQGYAERFMKSFPDKQLIVQ